jgi:uncharacterized protein (DUF305 family)
VLLLAWFNSPSKRFLALFSLLSSLVGAKRHKESAMKKIFLITLLTLLALANAQHNHSMGNASMTALEKASGKTFDIYWLSQMIEHHNGAVEMARAVLKDGKDARVKKAALNIIADQSKEVKQMTGWLKKWYNTVPDKKQIALMKQDMKPMMLAAQGGMAGMVMGNPDKNFLSAMIPHHQSAVDMSKLAQKKALEPELKTFAQNVIKVQTAEIKQYQAWLKTIR